MTIARVINLLIVILELVAFSIVRKNRSLKDGFIFYTQISNMVTFMASLLFVILGQNTLMAVCRYLAASMLAMTFFVTACILVPMSGRVKELLFSGSGVYQHLIIPILSTASYWFFEDGVRFEWFLLPVSVTLVYGLIMVYLNARGKADGPYPFFQVKRIGAGRTAIWMIALLIATSLLSIGIGCVR